MVSAFYISQKPAYWVLYVLREWPLGVAGSRRLTHCDGAQIEVACAAICKTNSSIRSIPWCERIAKSMTVVVMWMITRMLIAMLPYPENPQQTLHPQPGIPICASLLRLQLQVENFLESPL